MSTEILKQSSKIFDSFEKWNAFIELKANADLIKADWLKCFFSEARQCNGFVPPEFAEMWKYENRGNREIIWRLNGAGPSSLGLGFNLTIPRFGLFFLEGDRNKIQDHDKVLKCLDQKEEYNELKTLVESADVRNDWWPRAKDRYIVINETTLTGEQLAWCCRHRLNDVVNPIKERLEAAFRQTELFIKLNQETKK